MPNLLMTTEKHVQMLYNRASLDTNTPCVACQEMTKRAIVFQREGEGQWRWIPSCDFCFDQFGRVWALTVQANPAPAGSIVIS